VMTQSKEELERQLHQIMSLLVCSQLGEISVATNTSIPIPRASNQLQGDEDQNSRGEGDTVDGLVCRSEAEAQPVCPRIGCTVGKDDIHSTSHLPGPTVVPRVTAPKESGPLEVDIL